MIKNGKDKFGDNPTINFICEDLENPSDIGDESFDFIISVGAVLSITSNPMRILSEFFRILKKGERGVVSALYKNHYTLYMPSIKLANKVYEKGLIPSMYYPAKDLI